VAELTSTGTERTCAAARVDPSQVTAAVHVACCSSRSSGRFSGLGCGVGGLMLGLAADEVVGMPEGWVRGDAGVRGRGVAASAGDLTSRKPVLSGWNIYRHVDTLCIRSWHAHCAPASGLRLRASRLLVKRDSESRLISILWSRPCGRRRSGYRSHVGTGLLHEVADLTGLSPGRSSRMVGADLPVRRGTASLGLGRRRRDRPLARWPG
jgi:hypothetical protein